MCVFVCMCVCACVCVCVRARVRVCGVCVTVRACHKAVNFKMVAAASFLALDTWVRGIPSAPPSSPFTHAHIIHPYTYYVHR